MSNKPRALFLCTHNSARSQMAEAFLRKYGSDRFEAHSAGLEPAEIHPMTLQVMSEVGIDLLGNGQRSKGLDEYLMKVHVGYLITVCANAEAQCPIFPGVSVREDWGLTIRPPPRAQKQKGWPSSVRSETRSRNGCVPSSPRRRPVPTGRWTDGPLGILSRRSRLLCRTDAPDSDERLSRPRINRHRCLRLTQNPSTTMAVPPRLRSVQLCITQRDCEVVDRTSSRVTQARRDL